MDPTVEFDERIANKALIQLEDLVLNATNERLPSVKLPSPDREEEESGNRLLEQELNYDREELAQLVEERQNCLTNEQQVVMDKVMTMVDSGEGGLLFLDAPGGTGKTFLLNTILAKVRLAGKIALASASSGIAATLLVGGKTAHTTFGIPLKLQYIESPTSSINKGTNRAEMLKQASLIVIDECSALHRKGYEVIDDLLQDLTNTKRLFGGIPVLLAGDFRQTLPGRLTNQIFNPLFFYHT